jgi:hypothetical protein
MTFQKLPKISAGKFLKFEHRETRTECMSPSVYHAY